MGFPENVNFTSKNTKDMFNSLKFNHVSSKISCKRVLFWLKLYFYESKATNLSLNKLLALLRNIILYR